MGLKGETGALVVGAGPVGLFSALALAERGVDVAIIDKEWRGSTHSYALALHPASLRLLDDHGLADGLIEQGHRIQKIAFYEGAERAGVVDIAALGGPFPFVLVAPQNTVERALEDRLRRSKVGVLWNHELQSIRETADGLVARVARMEKDSMGYPIARTEWVIAKEIDVRTSFVVGADGYHSFVRRAAGVRFEHLGSAQAFSVFEFPCRVEFEDEARVVFHGATTNVVWPLPHGRARWSFEVDPVAPPAPTVENLRELCAERAPWFAREIDEVQWVATAMFERRLVDRFGKARIWLAGDAAHGTGPVGAQSMNVGLREAGDLAERISTVRDGGSSTLLFEDYDRARRAEWHSLLEIDGLPVPRSNAPTWAAARTGRIVPCIPASGAELARLLEQVGLVLA